MLIQHFWWGSKINLRRGTNWLSWDRLTVRKKNRGMDFKYLFAFNLAMLGKQGWKLVSGHDTIVSQVFKTILSKGRYLGFLSWS